MKTREDREADLQARIYDLEAEIRELRGEKKLELEGGGRFEYTNSELFIVTGFDESERGWFIVTSDIEKIQDFLAEIQDELDSGE